METTVDGSGVAASEHVGPVYGGMAGPRKRNTALVENLDENDRRSLGCVRGI